MQKSTNTHLIIHTV